MKHMARTIMILAKPGSRTEEVREREDGVYIVRVKARAVDGKANESVRKVLADHFGLAERDVVIRSGATSRLKRVEIS